VTAGRDDLTACFLCGGAVKDWEDTDEPWIEYAVWFPACLYANHMKGISFIQKCRGLKAAQGFEVCTDLI